MATRRRGDKEFSFLNNDYEEKMKYKNSNLKGDWGNIALLFFLYTLQGIPLGLAGAIPMILQNRGVSYKQQAEFSFVQWPFSLKLFWAPIVDAIFWKNVGRRKSWLIPTQYLLGIFMLLLSYQIDEWLGGEHGEPQIGLLTILFFSLNFLAATQDIAVDGWALTMLKKRNVAYASTCNSVGQTTGFFFGYVLFLALESAEFCNSYLRFEPEDVGLVTLPGFFFFWGWVFLVTTTLVGIFKHEVEHPDSEHDFVHEQNVQKAYISLWYILKLPAIRILAVVLLTCKIGFSATDSVLSLKLVESGIPREKLGLMAVPLVPVQIILPLIISKYTNGPKPMNIYLKYIPFRLFFGIIAAALVYITPMIVKNHFVPMHYYFLLLFCYGLHQVCVYSMFVAVMAFFNRVSDPKVGGTYMTLLNTLCNLGGNWPQTLALWFIDPLTQRNCVALNAKKKYFKASLLEHNYCKDSLEKELCEKNGGQCVTTLDGFYIETAICTLIGIAWYYWGRKKIEELQNLDEKAWKIRKHNSIKPDRPPPLFERDPRHVPKAQKPKPKSPQKKRFFNDKIFKLGPAGPGPSLRELYKSDRNMESSHERGFLTPRTENTVVPYPKRMMKKPRPNSEEECSKGFLDYVKELTSSDSDLALKEVPQKGSIFKKAREKVREKHSLNLESDTEKNFNPYVFFKKYTQKDRSLKTHKLKKVLKEEPEPSSGTDGNEIKNGNEKPKKNFTRKIFNKCRPVEGESVPLNKSPEQPNKESFKDRLKKIDKEMVVNEIKNFSGNFVRIMRRINSPVRRTRGPENASRDSKKRASTSPEESPSDRRRKEKRQAPSPPKDQDQEPEAVEDMIISPSTVYSDQELRKRNSKIEELRKFVEEQQRNMPKRKRSSNDNVSINLDETYTQTSNQLLVNQSLKETVSTTTQISLRAKETFSKSEEISDSSKISSSETFSSDYDSTTDSRRPCVKFSAGKIEISRSENETDDKFETNNPKEKKMSADVIRDKNQSVLSYFITCKESSSSEESDPDARVPSMVYFGDRNPRKKPRKRVLCKKRSTSDYLRERNIKQKNALLKASNTKLCVEEFVKNFEKKVSFSENEKLFTYEKMSEESDQDNEKSENDTENILTENCDSLENSVETFLSTDSFSSSRCGSRDSGRRKWKQKENNDSFHTIIAGKECHIKNYNKKDK